MNPYQQNYSNNPTAITDIASDTPSARDLMNEKTMLERHQYIVQQNQATAEQMQAQYLQKQQQMNEVQTEANLNARGTAEEIAAYKLKKYIEMMPANPPLGLIEKATSFITAMASAIVDARPSSEQQQARLAVCVECEAFEPNIAAPASVGWCKSCGCGKNPMSTLSFKATIAKSTCPKNLWDVTISASA